MSDPPSPAIYREEERNVRICLPKQAKEYADSATIHGVKYISEDGRHWSER